VAGNIPEFTRAGTVGSAGVALRRANRTHREAYSDEEVVTLVSPIEASRT
jgi:hypothetical protein